MAKAKTSRKTASKKTTKAKAPTKVKAPTKTKAKASVKVKAKPNGVSKRGVGYVEGELPFPMKIRGNLFYRFKAAAAELEAAISKSDVAQAQVDLLLAKPAHVAVAQALFHKAQVVSGIRVIRTEFAQIQVECGKKLGIPPNELQNYSFDSNTGVVLPATQPK